MRKANRERQSRRQRKIGIKKGRQRGRKGGEGEQGPPKVMKAAIKARGGSLYPKVKEVVRGDLVLHFSCDVEKQGKISAVSILQA